jgi:serine/threonine protein phosphatase PrpC
MAVEIIEETYYKNLESSDLSFLKESLQIANREIYKAAQRDQRYQGMATTCTALVIRDKEGFISHIGDSRAYLLRRGKLRQITEDHTLVGKLLKEGAISPQEAKTHPRRNVVLKALGNNPGIQPDSYRFYLEEGDYLVLCSDGLHGLVADSEIASILIGAPIEESGNKLIRIAKERGGTDNITVLIIYIKDEKASLKDTKPFESIPLLEVSKTKPNRVALLLSVLILFILAGFLFYWFSTNDWKKTPPDFDRIIRIN